MKKKISIICAISVASALLSVSLYAYIYSTVQDDQSSVSTLINQNRSNSGVLNDLLKIQKNLKSTVAIGDKLSALFVNQDSIVDFIQQIESLIKSSGVTGSVDSVAEETTPELDIQGKENLSIVINAKGNWNGLMKFVGLLENLPYKSTIDFVSLTNDKADKEDSKQKTVTVSSKDWKLSVKIHVGVIKSKKDNTPKLEPKISKPQSDE